MPTTISIETTCLAKLVRGYAAIDANQALARNDGCPRKDRDFRLTVEEDPGSREGQYQIRKKLKEFLGACPVCRQTELSNKLFPFEIPYIIEQTDTSIDIMEG